MRNQDQEYTLHTVHDAMVATMDEEVRLEEAVPTSIRIEPSVKALTQDICNRNGTSMACWLRQCCLALIADYGPEIKKHP